MEQLAARRDQIDHIVDRDHGPGPAQAAGAGLPVAGDAQCLHGRRGDHRGRRPGRGGRPVRRRPGRGGRAAPRRHEPRPRLAAARAVRGPAGRRRPGGRAQDRRASTPRSWPAWKPSIRRRPPPGVQAGAGAARRARAVDVLLGLERAVEDAIDERKTHHDEEEDHDHERSTRVSVDARPVGPRAAAGRPARAGGAPRDLSRQGLRRRARGKPMRLVVQGVGTRFDSYFDRPWRADEARATRLVLIGSGLRASGAAGRAGCCAERAGLIAGASQRCTCCPRAPAATSKTVARAWCAWPRRRATSWCSARPTPSCRCWPAWPATGDRTIPSVRLANLMWLRQPASVDLYVDDVLRHARVVVVDHLGGPSDWAYVVERADQPGARTRPVAGHVLRRRQRGSATAAAQHRGARGLPPTLALPARRRAGQCARPSSP